jgi:(5-formylfuran-3-yl)methyl phosphate synthase
MYPSRFLRSAPGLLVSVRSAAEAAIALAGGADVIDVKEPDRGPLGAADPNTIAEIVRIVGRQAPVTAAVGELLDVGPHGAMRTTEMLPYGVALFKIGLHGCRDVRDWKVRLSQAASRCDAQASRPQPVAVVYADWQRARAPDPTAVLRFAAESGCPALLIDTWDKSAGNLFVHWPVIELARFISQVRAHPIATVLAGSLSEANLVTALRLAPDLVAVRGAACENGRGGTITAARVAELKQMITKAGTPLMNPSPAPT